MTMHLPGYAPPPRRRDGMATIREDVHIHASAPTIRAQVSDPTAYRGWLTDDMRDFHADSEGVRFDLALPGRTETICVRRAPTEDLREVVFRFDGDGAVEVMAWGLFPEGERECHVTLEWTYRPAAGLFGGAFETLAHRPKRTQAIRDLLWNLKQDVERTAGILRDPD